ncbi:MAG: hypothetical protein LiPW41_544 [Parcubacteria group bacterium LiPW_41]|nr:MAG: hypothetical protein LiPW41_544 [Parcubacteria group bacterium LiPW_41]
MAVKISLSDLKVGGIYNRVYNGPNEAYAKINGKETFLVLHKKPELKACILFDQFGNVLAEDLRSNEITFPCPELAFEEFDIFRPEGEAEWFKKSIKFSSIKEAVEIGFINGGDVEQLAKVSLSHQVFIPILLRNNTTKVYCGFSVEGKTSSQFLQRIYILWDSWEDLKKEFKEMNLKIKPY